MLAGGSFREAAVQLTEAKRRGVCVLRGDAGLDVKWEKLIIVFWALLALPFTLLLLLVMLLAIRAYTRRKAA